MKRDLIVRMAMVLLLFILPPSTEVYGAVPFRTSISKMRNTIQHATDKLTLLRSLRKGMAVALLGTLIYVGDMPAVPIPEVAQSVHKEEARQNSSWLVSIDQGDDRQLRMPVHTFADDTFVVNPVIVREFAGFLAVFVDSTKNHEARDQANRVMRYWNENFGERGEALLAAIDAVRVAKKRAGLKGNYIPASKAGAVSEEIRELEQRLAFLNLEELTDSLNAAFKVEDVNSSRNRDIRSGLMRAYGSSGYLKVEIDAKGQATSIRNKLYNYYTRAPAGNARLAYKRAGVDSPAIMRLSHYHDFSYDIIMERAVVYGHLGLVSTLLVHGYNTGLDKYMLIALEVGHAEIAKTIFKRTRVNAQTNLNTALQMAASNKQTELVMALHNAGGDVNAGLIGAAVGGDVELTEFFIAAGATDVNQALQDSVLYGDEGALQVATYLATLDGIDLNVALKLAATYAGQEGGYSDWIEHLIYLGADNFNAALLAFAYDPSDYVSDLNGAKILMKYATNLDFVLSEVLESETATTNHDFTMYQEKFVRMLIRAGAGIEDGLLILGLSDGKRAAEAEALRRIFVEEN